MHMIVLLFRDLKMKAGVEIQMLIHCQAILLDQSLLPGQFLLNRVHFPMVDGSAIGLSSAV
ncbi:hypothetical protein DVH24_026968 [Malus domestica]|uniref:Uncharacterized protein n=1 Tax=Malus domestica TaxID=3750 RepID=A0A498ILI1_MALDO|nr:hypothetical protein DVH24_026968 [Malus domestica]